MNIKYNKTFDHFYNSDRNNLKNDDDEKRVETDFNLKDNQKSGKNLISKYKLLQKEIDNIKKQRNIEKKKNNKRFENLEKLILKFKKNNKELKNKENEDNV